MVTVSAKTPEAYPSAEHTQARRTIQIVVQTTIQNNNPMMTTFSFQSNGKNEASKTTTTSKNLTKRINHSDLCRFHPAGNIINRQNFHQI
jgi:aldehyde:ferredoxin oxidoreductase